jgi:hypothetical protein
MNKHNIKIWADQQDWSQGYTAVAKANNLSISTVWFRAKRLGIEVTKAKRGPITKTIRDIDWNLNNSELARMHGVSRQYIQQLRQRAGKPLPAVANLRHPLQDAIDDGCQIRISCNKSPNSIDYGVDIFGADFGMSGFSTNLFQAIHNAATEYREFKELFASPDSDEPEPEFPYSLP